MTTKKPDRKQLILEEIVKMLSEDKKQKITTATLAARLGVSESALYRHFPSKGRMFAALIDYIEEFVFQRIGQDRKETDDGRMQAWKICLDILGFVNANPGFARIVTGEALVGEDEALSKRMNELFDRTEMTLAQSLRHAEMSGHGGNLEPRRKAAALTAYVAGRIFRFARGGLKGSLTDNADEEIAAIVGI